MWEKQDIILYQRPNEIIAFYIDILLKPKQMIKILSRKYSLGAFKLWIQGTLRVRKVKVFFRAVKVKNVN